MKNLIVIIAATLSLASCTQENIRVSNEQSITNYNFTDIEAIDISGEFEVEVDLSTSNQGVQTSFNKELQNLITVENVDGTLKVYYNQSVNIRGNVKNTILITTSNIKDVRTTGEVNVIVAGKIASDRLAVNMTGESKFISEIDVEELNMTLTGESNVNLTGEATNVHAEMAGDSYFSDFGLIINNLNISMTGESSVKLRVEDTIDISASGESEFEYMGGATFINRSTAGESKITKIG